MPYMKQLIEGYRRFREKSWAQERERWAELAEGQSPQVMILACADSRSDPAQIFDARPGEMFVARNIAALAPPYETSPGLHGVSSALEFAVTQLEVGEILVMGHGMCGGAYRQLRRRASGRRPLHRRLGADAVGNA
jgi:carbonic anhydrase